jgi:hypothetical protein
MFGISPNGNNFDNRMVTTEMMINNLDVKADDKAICDGKLESDSMEPMEMFNNEEAPETLV